MFGGEPTVQAQIRGSSPSRLIVADGYAIKVKEGEKVKILPFPTIANLKEWKIDTYTSVLAASGRSDSLVVTWLRESEDPSITFEKLGEAPLELVTLDRKLSFALIGVCKGEFKRMVPLRHEERMQKESVPLAGPQILRMILEYFRTTQSLTTNNLVMNLGRVPWKRGRRVAVMVERVQQHS